MQGDGEYFDSRTLQRFLRARWQAGHRFPTFDPFFGNSTDPLSFHKYGFVHANPVMGIDPSGRFIMSLGGLIVGSFMSKGMDAKWARVTTKVGFTSLGALLDTLFIRRHDFRDRKDQLPLASKHVWSNTTQVRVTGASITAGQMFDRLASFNSEDYKPTLANTQLIKEGDKKFVTWSFDQPFGIGQPPFDVRIDQYDRSNRFLSVVTLSGHPLSGFRYFRVVAANDTDQDFVLETGAVDHPTLMNDYMKMYLDYSGLPLLGDNLLATWSGAFTQMAKYAGGKSELRQSRWLYDAAEHAKIKALVNWRVQEE
jgi:hypothetical protein